MPRPSAVRATLKESQELNDTVQGAAASFLDQLMSASIGSPRPQSASPAAAPASPLGFFSPESASPPAFNPLAFLQSPTRAADGEQPREVSPGSDQGSPVAPAADGIGLATPPERAVLHPPGAAPPDGPAARHCSPGGDGSIRPTDGSIRPTAGGGAGVGAGGRSPSGRPAASGVEGGGSGRAAGGGLLRLLRNFPPASDGARGGAGAVGRAGIPEPKAAPAPDVAPRSDHPRSADDGSQSNLPFDEAYAVEAPPQAC